VDRVVDRVMGEKSGQGMCREKTVQKTKKSIGYKILRGCKGKQNLWKNKQIQIVIKRWTGYISIKRRVYRATV